MRIFEWFKSFQYYREDVEDDSCPGRRSTSKTDKYIEIIGNILRSNRRLTICAIAETVGIEMKKV